MTLAVQDLLRSFDALTEHERREAVAEVLLRIKEFEQPALTDEELTTLAEEAFLGLDRDEEFRE